MIAGFIAMAWMILLFFLKQETSGIGLFDPYFCMMVLAVVIYITILHKRDKDQDGILSFKDGIIAGVVAAFMMGLMIGAYKMVYVKYVNPGLVEEVVKQARSFIQMSGGTDEQIKNAEDGARASYSPFGQFTYGIGATMLTGAALSLVCTVIMRRAEKTEV